MPLIMSSFNLLVFFVVVSFFPKSKTTSFNLTLSLKPTVSSFFSLFFKSKRAFLVPKILLKLSDWSLSLSVFPSLYYYTWKYFFIKMVIMDSYGFKWFLNNFQVTDKILMVILKKFVTISFKNKKKDLKKSREI